MASVIRFIGGQGIQWLGYIWQTNEDDICRLVLMWKLTGKRSRGRTRKKWLDVVEEDLNQMGVQK